MKNFEILTDLGGRRGNDKGVINYYHILKFKFTGGFLSSEAVIFTHSIERLNLLFRFRI